MLQTGVRVEFDSAFRWKAGEPNQPFAWQEALLPDFPNQITVGMDAFRNTYWHAYGSAPGLTYLLTTFRDELSHRGLANCWNRLLINNPTALCTCCQPL
ncbi:hypothetical protein FAES_3188 [Fibrella aestuarina BUZ 2]|uniref:Uncharacterized protein n=1 Tax=Fibrella aestuarina BUZ 2 TaxID=1166018 RepID=I0KAP4_9BACT|nr:hypothetical protein [Fibrella aestuarina]CCH01197.1 hypothetical protein FAES_3188 [Fibrella aestuarina BUZ 2]